MKATTIEEVIEVLDLIIEDAKKNQSPKGYFAALYRKVTVDIKQGIENDAFENGFRMEKLDVIFANRYLEAHRKYYQGQKLSECWKVAFDNSVKYSPIVLQHLLWGINAHINLDLGIAVVETASGESIYNLKNDFDKINELLANLVEEVEQDLSDIWPTLKYILTFLGKIDDFLINFSMKTARDGAWKFTTKLSLATAEERRKMILERDSKIAKIADYINPPGIISKLIFRFIRIKEKGDIAKRIKILE